MRGFTPSYTNQLSCSAAGSRLTAVFWVFWMRLSFAQLAGRNSKSRGGTAAASCLQHWITLQLLLKRWRHQGREIMAEERGRADPCTGCWTSLSCSRGQECLLSISRRKTVPWELPQVWNKQPQTALILITSTAASCHALKATRQNCFRDGQLHQAGLEGKEVSWTAVVWTAHAREETGLGPVVPRVWDNKRGYSLWALRYQTPHKVKGTQIPSLLLRILPLDPSSKLSFLMVDGDLVWLNIFLYHAAKTRFPPCQDKRTHNPLIMEHTEALTSTSSQKASALSHSCLKHNTQHRDFKNMFNGSFYRNTWSPFKHNQFFLKKKLWSQWQILFKKTSKQLHKTEHMVLIPPHTQTAAAETHLTRRKSLTKTTALHPAEIIPCTWN